MAKKFNKPTTGYAQTIDEAFTEFIEEKEANNISKATIRNYKHSFNAFLNYHEIDAETAALTAITLQQFYKWINHMKQNEVRPTSINHYLRDWRTFLNWCYNREKIQEAIKVKEIEAQEELPKMYDDEDMAKMLVKPREGDSFSDWRSWAIISLIYATGLRAATVCHLCWEDISFEREEIVIERQKNKKAGVLPLTPALANTLKEYRRIYISSSGEKPEPTDWLFPSTTGGQFTVSGLGQSIGRYCKHLGIDGHGAHSIRHNFARDMILNGAGEYRLQRYLQHSSIQMSQHYVKLFSSDLKKNAEEFSPLDNAKKKASRTSKFSKK